MTGLSDYEQISNVLAKYCFATDRGTAEDIAACFWDDAEVNFAGRINSGKEAFTLGFEKWITKMRDPLVGLRHILHTPLIEIRGETATAEAYYDADGHSKNKGKLIQLRGVYRDKLEKRGGEWRLLAREVQIWRSVLDHAGNEKA